MNKKLLVIVLLMSLLLVSSVYGGILGGILRSASGPVALTCEEESEEELTCEEELSVNAQEPTSNLVEERVVGDESGTGVALVTESFCNNICQSSTKCKGIDEAWRKISGVLNGHSTNIWCPGDSQWNDYDAVYVPKTPTSSPSGTTPGSFTSVICPNQYTPGSAEQIALFTKAAHLEGLDKWKEWGSSKAIQEILRLESGGCVGIPNYKIEVYRTEFKDYRQAKYYPDTWPDIHAALRQEGDIGTNFLRLGTEGNFKVTYPIGDKMTYSTATGLGQLLASNMDAYAPEGRKSIGDALGEARGMLRYIYVRHGTPEVALEKRKGTLTGEGY